MMNKSKSIAVLMDEGLAAELKSIRNAESLTDENIYDGLRYAFETREEYRELRDELAAFTQRRMAPYNKEMAIPYEKWGEIYPHEEVEAMEKAMRAEQVCQPRVDGQPWNHEGVDPTTGRWTETAIWQHCVENSMWFALYKMQKILLKATIARFRRGELLIGENE